MSSPPDRAPRTRVGFSYPGINNQILTGSPDYGARILINGDPGKGCSSDLHAAVQHLRRSQGPAVNSTGLESGQNYMRGCPDHVWDFAIARNIRFGGGRQLQLRLEMFNAFGEVIITGRNSHRAVREPAGSDARSRTCRTTPTARHVRSSRARAARDSASPPAHAICERSRRRSGSRSRDEDTENG